MDIDQNNKIGYWLFYAQRCIEHACSEALRVCCEEQKKPYVITPAQWGLLATLYVQDGLTVGVISQSRGLDAPTVTGIITRLQQNGLVQRVHDTKDRRIVQVFLTDESRAIMVPLNEAMSEFYRTALQGFSQEDQIELVAKLHLIIANLSTIGADTGDRFKLLSASDHHIQSGKIESKKAEHE